jgi:hypothetical protein
VNANQSINSIVINDMKGALVYKTSTGLKTNSYKVNTARLSKGIYLARIATDNDMKVVKFIVK